MPNWSAVLGGLGSSAWGTAKPYATDPLAWLGAAGTGLGIYDIIRRQQAEKQFLRRQRDWQQRVEAMSSAPLNVEAIFNPAKTTIQRDLESGLAERGLQPGGAYSAAMGEGMMRQYLNAAQLAQAQRASQLGAMTGIGPTQPNFPAVGDTSAFGKYLQHKRESMAAEKARGQQQSNYEKLLEIMRGGGGGRPSWPGPGRSQSIDMYPDIPETFSGSPSESWYE